MRLLTIAALVAAQLAPCATPAMAAELIGEPRAGETRVGGFAGARIRIGIGGQRERVRAGLTVAPSIYGLERGAVRMRMGEGVAFGMTDGRAPELTLAGRPVAEPSGGKGAPKGRRHGVSTLGWVGIGAGVVLLAGVAVFGWMVSEGNSQTD